MTINAVYFQEVDVEGFGFSATKSLSGAQICTMDILDSEYEGADYPLEMFVYEDDPGGFVGVSEGDVSTTITLETNNASVPVDSFTITSLKPFIYVKDAGFDDPFTGAVTKGFLTSSDNSLNIKAIIGVNLNTAY